MSRRQTDGMERPVALARRGRSQSPHSTAAAVSREKRGKQSRVEGRWVGRWMRNGPERSTESTVSARKGSARCRSSQLFADGSFGLDSPHGVGAGNGVKEGRWSRDRWIISSGQHFFAQDGLLAFIRPYCLRDTPDEGTADWRAVCGKTARTVRRAGRGNSLPDPYRL